MEVEPLLDPAPDRREDLPTWGGITVHTLAAPATRSPVLPTPSWMKKLDCLVFSPVAGVRLDLPLERRRGPRHREGQLDQRPVAAREKEFAAGFQAVAFFGNYGSVTGRQKR